MGMAILGDSASAAIQKAGDSASAAIQNAGQDMGKGIRDAGWYIGVGLALGALSYGRHFLQRLQT